YLAGVVTPRRVKHLADGRLLNIARDDEVQQLGRVAAAHQVLVERRHVEERRRGANDMVFTLVGELVGARDDVAGPAPPGMAYAERRSALVKRRGLEHQLRRAPVPASK